MYGSVRTKEDTKILKMASIFNRIKTAFMNRVPMKPGECKMVIVVRTDIPMGKGKIGAQCAHAALECYRKSISIGSNRRVFNSWLLFGQPKVVLRISSEKELLSLAQKSRDSGLVTAVIRDAGRTQLEPGTISVLGIGPAPTNIVDKVTSSLKLL